MPQATSISLDQICISVTIDNNVDNLYKFTQRVSTLLYVMQSRALNALIRIELKN